MVLVSCCLLIECRQLSEDCKAPFMFLMAAEHDGCPDFSNIHL